MIAGRSRRTGWKGVGPALIFVVGVAVGATWLDGRRVGAWAHGREPEARNQKADAHWLSEATEAQRSELEQHLRGLDVAMVEIGYRFDELYFAGQDRNWPYAQYQIEKIELALRLALQRRPKRAASAKPFLEETIPLVKQSIEAESANKAGAYRTALERLRMDCMKCHVAENVPYFTVNFPQNRASAIRPGETP